MPRKKKTKKHPRLPKYSLLGLLVLMAGALLYWGSVTFMGKSKYFTVKSVTVNPALTFINKRDTEKMMGENIFSVDLKKYHRRLSFKYPQVSELKIVRRFPNEIYVTAKSRLPFAQMKVKDKIIILDEKGVVLKVVKKEDKQLPVIVGVIESRWVNLGLPLKGKDVFIALRLIKSFKNEKFLKSYSIKEINVSNLSKMEFTLSSDVKVIIDQDKILQNVRVLAILLSQGRLDMKQVEYIDLRFKEPIIGKK